MGGAHLHYTIQSDLALYAVFLGERAFSQGWASLGMEKGGDDG